jgi:membrane protease YdiL (CAAX protease family)
MITSPSNPILKVLIPLAGIIIIYIVARWKKVTKQDLLLNRPAIEDLLLWLFVWLVFIGITDYWFGWRGKFDFTIWHTQSLLNSVCRVLAVGFLGPVLEELIFRGTVFFRLRTSIKNEWFRMTLIALAWAFIHLEYNYETRLLIFANGLLLGTALIRSRSLYIPIIFHITWNLYAVW